VPNDRDETRSGRRWIDRPVDLARLTQTRFRLAALRTALLGALALLLAWTSFYTVEPEEIGAVTRLGRFVAAADPGLHLKLPLGIDRVTKVPVQRQLKHEFGFRTTRAAVRSEFERIVEEATMLTGDLNSALVEWVVQYRIADPYAYLFRVREVDQTLRDLSEAVMRQIVGDRTVDEVLTVGRQEVAALAETQLQELCTAYETGLEIEQVVLQDVTPPDPVKPSFNEVNQAEQERATLVNQAQSEYNKAVFKAEGEAQRTIATAEGYAIDRVNRARGEAARFEAVYAEYRKAPDVTRRRLYLEGLTEVLQRVGRKVVVDDDLRSILPLLPLQGQAAAPSQERER
jgi:membrane protease subunit HflK